MGRSLGIFTEHDDGTFSWRKMFAFIGLLAFVAYNVIILIQIPTDIPTGVRLLLAIIFSFYFGKASIGYAAKAIKEKFNAKK